MIFLPDDPVLFVLWRGNEILRDRLTVEFLKSLVTIVAINYANFGANLIQKRAGLGAWLESKRLSVGNQFDGQCRIIVLNDQAGDGIAV